MRGGTLISDTQHLIVGEVKRVTCPAINRFKGGNGDILRKRKGIWEHFAAPGGPLTVFQRNGAITQGRVAATWPNERIAAGNISCI
jgi:hypothetical protein